MSLLGSFLSDTHGFMTTIETSVLLDVSKAPFPSADFARKIRGFLFMLHFKNALEQKVLIFLNSETFFINYKCLIFWAARRFWKADSFLIYQCVYMYSLAPVNVD